MKKIIFIISILLLSSNCFAAGCDSSNKTNLWPFSYFETLPSFPPSDCAPAAQNAEVPDNKNRTINKYNFLNTCQI